MPLRDFRVTGVLFQLSGWLRFSSYGRVTIGRKISRYFATRGQNEPQLRPRRIAPRRHKGGWPHRNRPLQIRVNLSLRENRVSPALRR